MKFGQATVEERTFRPTDLANAFDCSLRQIYVYLKALNLSKHTKPALYSVQDYLKMKTYINSNETQTTEIEPETENKHALVKDKRFLRLSFFPSNEEITPKQFMEM